MGRSKESSKRKRSSGSRDSGYYAKRSTSSVSRRIGSFRKEENAAESSTSGSIRSFCNVTTFDQIPYYGWTTYFFNQEYNEKSTTLTRIDAFMEFFERNKSRSRASDFETDLNLDVDECAADSALLQKWPSVVEHMNVNPQHAFNCIRAAFFEIMLRRLSAYKILPFMKIFRVLRLHRVNIINHESLNALPHLKLSSFGKLVSISGVVINTGAPKLGPTFVVLTCACESEIIATQEHGAIFAPRKCNVCGHGRMKRSLDSPHQFAQLEQSIQIKDHRLTDQTIADDGNATNIVSVKLKGLLVDAFVPGDKIKVIGIPRITLGVAKSTTPGSCPLYVDAISAFGDDGNDDEVCGKASGNSDKIPVDWSIIESIKSNPDVLSLLTKSLCPRVQGHEAIKTALILGMFAGNSEHDETRDYVHTLVIGDLGLGKSQLLRACAQVAPKGVYARGSSMKSLEPTMINVRDAGVEDSRLETGAFSLASDGLYCIDELDKVSAQHQSIHACMEERRASITNSELKLELAARAAIAGIINPIRKRYDPSKTVLENVNARPELLSRFDMIFLMRDRPDTYRDKLMCDRMLDVYNTRSTQFSERTLFSGSEYRARNSRIFTNDLDTPDESRSDILSPKFFQMYVNCARMFVKPEVLSAPRADIHMFCSLRYQTHKDFVAVERLVRTMIILSQAHAKIDLRGEVTEEDVEKTIEILEQSKLQTADRPADRLETSSGNANKLTTNKVNQFMSDLRTEARLLNKASFTADQLLVIAGSENFTEHSFSSLLSKLNEQGYLLKVSANLYKLVSN